MFICLGLFVQIKIFLLIWRRHHDRWRAANFDLCTALMVIEQWGFFRVPHLLWHGGSVYNSHFRGHVTLIPNAERLTVELSLTVYSAKVCRGRNLITQPSACGNNQLWVTCMAIMVSFETITMFPILCISINSGQNDSMFVWKYCCL